MVEWSIGLVAHSRRYLCATWIALCLLVHWRVLQRSFTVKSREMAIDNIAAMYQVKYPEDESHGKALAMEFDGDVEALRHQVMALTTTLGGLAAEEKALRKVALPRKPSARATEAMVREIICATAHSIAASDIQWSAMDRSELEQCSVLGDLLREARLAGVPVKGMNSVEDLRNAVLAMKGWLQPPLDEYEVLEVVVHRTTDQGQREYMVKWKVGPATWESGDHPSKALQDLVAAYEASRAAAHKRGPQVTAEELQQLQQGAGVGAAREEKGEEEAARVALMASMKVMADGQSELQEFMKKMAKKEGAAESDDEDGSQWRLGSEVQVLRGGKRLKQLDNDFGHYREERNVELLYASHYLTMDAPFAKEHNAALNEFVELEKKALEHKLEVQKAKLRYEAAPEDAAKRDVYYMAKARAEHLQKQWLLKDDRWRYIGQLSKFARRGNVAVAQKMFENMQKQRDEVAWLKQFRKDEKTAVEDIRKGATIDQATYMAGHLGQASAMFETAEARAAATMAFQGGRHSAQGYGGGAGQGRVPLPPGPPEPRPLPLQPFQGLGGLQQQQGAPLQQGALMQPGARRSGAATAMRTKFLPAEEVLKGPPPPALVGHMLPVGPTFFTPGKALDDPPKVRQEPFAHKCKLCDRVGHEAFECMESFSYLDKPAKSFRQLHQSGVVDRHGRYVM